MRAVDALLLLGFGALVGAGVTAWAMPKPDPDAIARELAGAHAATAVALEARDQAQTALDRVTLQLRDAERGLRQARVTAQRDRVTLDSAIAAAVTPADTAALMGPLLVALGSAEGEARACGLALTRCQELEAAARLRILAGDSVTARVLVERDQAVQLAAIERAVRRRSNLAAKVGTVLMLTGCPAAGAGAITQELVVLSAGAAACLLGAVIAW